MHDSGIGPGILYARQGWLLSLQLLRIPTYLGTLFAYTCCIHTYPVHSPLMPRDALCHRFIQTDMTHTICCSFPFTRTSVLICRVVSTHTLLAVSLSMRPLSFNRSLIVKKDAQSRVRWSPSSPTLGWTREDWEKSVRFLGVFVTTSLAVQLFVLMLSF